jgi:hypothetical protein
MGRNAVRVGTAVLVSALALGLVGCHDDGDGEVQAGGAGQSGGSESGAGSDPGPGELHPGPVDGPVHGTLSVLESPEHGPQLCSGMADSLPPQCGGPDIVGWSWDDVDGEETVGGTTWGAYELVGTWDGGRFTLTERPAPPAPIDHWGDLDFASPCPAPEGGWAVVDPAKATQAALDAAGSRAQARDDFAGMWVDQSINPASGEPIEGLEDELALNDPMKLVLNVRVTGDVAATEQDLREVWGGALCVSPAERTRDELTGIQDEVTDELADTGLFQGSSSDEVHGVVEVETFVDGGLQDQLDARYGPGVVELTALLQPVDG